MSLSTAASNDFFSVEEPASSAALRFVACGICLFFSLVTYSVRADSWLPPTAFDTFSENGGFVAHVTPANTNYKATVVVSAIKNHRTNGLWRASLSNDYCPTEVVVSDDGSSVVTLDNWGGVGYGDNVVAIYGPSGLKAKYSLEEFAPPAKPKASSDVLIFSIHGGYDGKFVHSTSSRHWRRYSIYFFYPHARESLFCLWLDWEKRWVVWQMADGKLRKVTADLASKLNTEGRNRALQEVKTGENPSAALNFIGRLRRPEDRPLIEAWLRDSKFSTSSTMSYSSAHPNPSFRYNAYSFKRQEAESILSCWDGITTNICVMGSLEEYHFLGTIKGQVALSVAPKKGDGTLRLYLIPTDVPLEKWSGSRPQHYLIADLHSNFPMELEDQKMKDFPLGRTIDFIFYGVTAGNYRLKAVWNKTPPFAKPETIVCLPRSGDYENTSSPLIAVKRGRIIDGVHIECSTPAGKQREHP